MTLDPGPPRRNPSGGLGGAAPQWVRVLDPARRPGPGPPALPGITRPGSKKGYGFGFGIGFWAWVIFPGFWRMLQTQISNISRRPKIQKNQISNISRRAIINSNPWSI